MSPGQERSGPDGWDDAGFDAAFADIVARLRTEDPETPAPGEDHDPATPSAPRPDEGAEAGAAPPAAEPTADASPTTAEPDTGSASAPEATGTADPLGPPGPTPHPGSTTPPQSAVPRDEGEVWRRREAELRRIEDEIDRAVDGPDGGRFVPPEPPPLPQLDAITAAAWVGVVGGPLFLVLAAILKTFPTWSIGAAVAALIIGFVLLVSRLPRHDEQDPDDDGAVV